MKIAILTLPLHTNYGGILQAYALQTVLERMGHDVAVINYNQHVKKYVADPKWRRCLTYPWRFINKYVFRRGNGFIQYEKRINESRRYKDKYLKDFISQNIKYVSCDALAELDASTYDAIVVGSDQVWRRAYFNNSERIENAYLAFAYDWNIRRIAYGASFGKDNIDEYNKLEKDACKELIRKFDAVSVREKTGVEICRKEFGVLAKCLLDPTLLLNKEDYNMLIPKQTERRDILFYYILDETSDILQKVNDYAAAKKYKPYRVNALPEDSDASLEQRVQRPISEWLYAFASANEIITDSFHACVFSIIYNKPFWVLLNHNRGASRIHSLLEIFGLQSRILDNINELYLKEQIIDWVKVNKIHKEKRTESIDFLKNNLKISPPLPEYNKCENLNKCTAFFSIIIPIYNSKDKIEKCLNSILFQSYASFEIILVDDGSCDGSSECCDYYATLDVRIKVIHKINGGPSIARNIGLDNAIGDWIVYVDADDTLLPGALAIYNDIISRHREVDMIRAGYIKKGKSGNVTKVAIASPCMVASKEDFYLKSRNSMYGGFLWNTCYSSKVAQQVRMDEEISWCEDHIYTYKCMSISRAVFFTNALVYKYSYDDFSPIGYGHCLSTKRKDYKMVIKAAEADRNVKMELYAGNRDMLKAIHVSYINKIQIALYYSFFNFQPFIWLKITRDYLSSDYLYLSKLYFVYIKGRIKHFCNFKNKDS